MCFCCLDDTKLTISCLNCQKECCINCLYEANSFIHCPNCKTGTYNLISVFQTVSKKEFKTYINGWINEKRNEYESISKPIQIQAHDYTEMFFEIPEGIIEDMLIWREIISIFNSAVRLQRTFMYGNVYFTTMDRAFFNKKLGQKVITDLIEEISTETWILPTEFDFELLIDDHNEIELMSLFETVLNTSKYNLLNLMNKETLDELIRLRKRYNKKDAEQHLLEFMLRKNDLKKSIHVEEIKPIVNCARCNGVVIQIDNDTYACNLCKTKYCDKCMQPLISSNKHDHTQESIDQWKLIQETTKPCPKCGFRFEKLNGCDDMFCTNCHTGFQWSTGEIKLGSFHNPERQKWLSNSSTILSDTLREYDLETRIDIAKQMLDPYHDNLSLEIRELANSYSYIQENKFHDFDIEKWIVIDICQEDILQTLINILTLYEKNKANKYTVHKNMYNLYLKIETYRHIFRNQLSAFTWLNNFLKLMN